MFPEKGPVFSESLTKLEIKWRDLLATSQIVRLVVQRFYFDAGTLGSALLFWQFDGDKRISFRKGFCLLIDVAVGAYLVSWMTGRNGDLCTGLLSYCLEVLRSGVFNLTGILNWLMGNPAGLKLNKELAHTLGAFFKHHISLWQMYINYLTNLLEGGDMILCSFGLLGVSFFGALVVDFISLFTVHVHCFYIYMARLFNVQLRGLVALGRFFTGKKWNPLRRRVDHVSSSVDQLFVGSLIMMVFVFLLPTTVTFYFVFATLHVLVRVVQLPFRLLSRWTELAAGSSGSEVLWTKSTDPNQQKTTLSADDSSPLLRACRRFFLGEII